MSAADPGDLFVGRDRELDILRSLIDSIDERKGAIAIVAGEPGIGKSSLLREARRYAGEHGYTELIGSCIEDEGAPPFWPWVQAFRSYIEERTADELRRQLGADAALIAELLPGIRSKIPDLPTQPVDTDSERGRFRLFDAIGQFLKRAGLSQPLLVVLEDIHSADEPSLRLLTFLSQQLERLRVLFVSSYRDIDVRSGQPLFRALGELTGRSRIERISLRGWEIDDTRRYLALVGSPDMPIDMAERLHHQSGGTPMFVAEFARLIPTGSDTGDPGDEAGWSSRLPEGIGEVIGRRLGRLSSSAYSVLSFAAVVGNSFSLSFLELAWQGAGVVDALDEAEDAAIINPIEEHPGTYCFHHDLFRRALLDAITATTRAIRHSEVAAAIEIRLKESTDGTVADSPAAIATHLQKAGEFADKSKIFRYATLAGDRALSLYAYEEARSYYLQALDAIGCDAETPEAAELWFGIGKSSIPMRRYDDHEVPLGRAFALCEQLGLSELGVRIALALDHHSKLSHVKRLAIEMSEPGSADRAVLLAQFALQLTFLGDGVDEAHRCIEKAHALAEEIGAPRLSAYIVRVHGRVEYNHGEWDEALELAEQAVILSNRVGDDRLCADAYVRVGMVYLNTPRPGRSLEAGRRAIECAKRSGDRWSLFWALQLQSQCLAEFGEFEPARAMSNELLAISPSFFSSIGQRIELEANTGDVEVGRRFLNRFLEVTVPEGNAMRGGVPDWSVVEALSLWIFLTDETEYIELADAAVRTVFTEGVAGPTARWLAYPGVARLAVAHGDPAEGLRWYERMTSDYLNRFGLDHVLGIAALAAGLRSDAIHHLEAAWHSSSESGRLLVQLESGFYLASLYQADSATADLTSEIVEIALHETRRRGMRLWMAKFETIGRHRAQGPDASIPATKLSEREIEVVQLVAEGLKDREIAERLFISPKTVSNHLANVREKLGCRNRTEVARIAGEHGLLSESASEE